jgi:hypothetical protein
MGGAGSTPRSGRGGRRFKSCHSDQPFSFAPNAYAASYAERNSPVIISRRRLTPVLQPKSEATSFGLATRILRRATCADKAVAAVNAGGGASGESASGVSMSVIFCTPSTICFDPLRTDRQRRG